MINMLGAVSVLNSRFSVSWREELEGGGEIETQLDEEEEGAAAVAGVASQSAHHHVVEEVHDQTGDEDQQVPAQQSGDGTDIEQGEQGEDALKEETDAGGDAHLAIHGLVLGRLLGAGIGQEHDDLGGQHLAIGVGGEDDEGGEQLRG